jgi:hypothetical protein
VHEAPARPGPAATGWIRRASTWLVVPLLCAAASAAAGGFTGGGLAPDPSAPWVDDVALSSAERRELDARRAALKTRADDVAGLLGSCLDLRSRVRSSLAGVQHVRAVEVGLVLFTSHPPQLPVTFATALGSGRVVRDRLMVIVPVRPRVVPLDGSPGSIPAPRCPPAP